MITEDIILQFPAKMPFLCTVALYPHRRASRSTDHSNRPALGCQGTPAGGQPGYIQDRQSRVLPRELALPGF